VKNTKCPSDRILPPVLHINAEASRSKSAPDVVRGSQPRPTMTAVSPGASLESETLPPLFRLTPIWCSTFLIHPRCIDDLFYATHSTTVAAPRERRCDFSDRDTF